MPVGAERLAVDKGLRDGVDGLVAREAEHLGDDGGGGDLDEDDVVEADAVEGVEQREAALDLVCLDHALEEVTDCEVGLARPREVVGDGEDGAEVVGRVSPFCSRNKSAYSIVF